MHPAAAAFQSACATTCLSPGQSLHTAVPAGTVLLVREGRLRIDEAPQWLAERCIGVSRALAAGEHHVLNRAGWICLTAPEAGPGASLCMAPPSAPRPAARAPLWPAMRRLVGF